MDRLDTIADSVIDDLARASAAREQGLANSRRATRNSANAIRALHRGHFEAASQLLTETEQLLAEAGRALAEFPSTRWAGFIHDAEKEYAEAQLTAATFRGHAIPTPEELGVSGVAWLHGVAECVGELRRSVLDLLRRAEIDAAEERVGVMDAMYEVLTRVDFPDSMTSGLRRATDVTRGILERTRADLTNAAVQRRLEVAIEAHLGHLGDPPD